MLMGLLDVPERIYPLTNAGKKFSGFLGMHEYGVTEGKFINVA